ncbi:hypothetical protein EYF80_008821 [Liparis tanakae]|uniref:Uncharacterized protein n=1 Tax=Liparis tanakae TaxID=230148 RepID=A0A4Z2ISJ3_9TELE|nr:hypothetical protein EYF80_008821 [Liparis tanakae]
MPWWSSEELREQRMMSGECGHCLTSSGKGKAGRCRNGTKGEKRRRRGVEVEDSSSRKGEEKDTEDVEREGARRVGGSVKEGNKRWDGEKGICQTKEKEEEEGPQECGGHPVTYGKENGKSAGKET